MKRPILGTVFICLGIMAMIALGTCTQKENIVREPVDTDTTFFDIDEPQFSVISYDNYTYRYVVTSYFFYYTNSDKGCVVVNTFILTETGDTVFNVLRNWSYNETTDLINGSFNYFVFPNDTIPAYQIYTLNYQVLIGTYYHFAGDTIIWADDTTTTIINKEMELIPEG